MKKILLLGGSPQQVVAIKTARRLGLKTVLCDYLPDNPGQIFADRYYNVSTTKKEEILDVAIKEDVDGIIAYASDPAAPTAAYVAEKLGLPTNPYSSVDMFCHKDKFREFLRNNNFNAPESLRISDTDYINNLPTRIHFPVIVKPVDSSGSKGVSIVNEINDLESKIEYAMNFSRSHCVIVETYIEKKHKYLIGGDVFVYNSKIVLWGLMNCHRDSSVNPLVPVGKSFPLDLSDDDVLKVKKVLQRIVEKAGIRNGPMNVELIIDKDGQVWPIDIGPRSGGNMIPDLLKHIFGVDIVEMCIKCAMGQEDVLNGIREYIGNGYYVSYNIHAETNGILKELYFDSKIKEFIVEKNIYKRKGDSVNRFDNASDALGVVIFKFDTLERMKNFLDDPKKWIKVILD